jgi:tetratricopeptide (TPR) repeat protein
VEEETVDLLRTASSRLPGHAQLQAELGAAVAALGPTGEGIAILEEALDLGAPPATLLTLGDAYLAAGNPLGAEASARAYLAVFPDRLRPRLLMARSFLAQGDREAARAELVRCIRRQTVARSPAVDAVANEAQALWKLHFNEPPPHSGSGTAVGFESLRLLP